jgi:hypothetical protein
VKTTLETSGEDVKTTLETSGEDVKTTLETGGNKYRSKSISTFCSAHSRKIFTQSFIMTFLGAKTTLETSGEDAKLHSKRVEKMRNYSRNECI